jgi:hypothetical protein
VSVVGCWFAVGYTIAESNTKPIMIEGARSFTMLESRNIKKEESSSSKRHLIVFLHDVLNIL